MTTGSAGSSGSPLTAGISRRRLLAAAAGAAGFAALPTSARAAAETVNRLHDIGSIAGPGTPSEATDINDRGDIVGATSLPGTETAHAFIMNPRVRGGRLIDITPLEGRSSRAVAVNGSGVVVGTLGMGLTPSATMSAQSRVQRGAAGAPGPSTRSNQPQQTFVWGPRTGLDILPLPPGTAGAQACDINDEGMVLVVGTSDVPDPNVPGSNIPVGSYLWDPASHTYTQLLPTDPSIPGVVCLAARLDERGGAAGGVVVPVDEKNWRHSAVVWEPGSLTPHQLSTGGVSDAFATDRNENGLIVGWRMNAPGGLSNAVYWPTQDAPPVELPGRVAFEVNDAGQIVGIRDFPDSSVFPFTAVMWEPARGRTTALGDKSLGSYVVAVNASGRSAGYAVAEGEENHYNTAVWWDPPRR